MGDDGHPFRQDLLITFRKFKRNIPRTIRRTIPAPPPIAHVKAKAAAAVDPFDDWEAFISIGR